MVGVFSWNNVYVLFNLDQGQEMLRFFNFNIELRLLTFTKVTKDFFQHQVINGYHFILSLSMWVGKKKGWNFTIYDENLMILAISVCWIVYWIVIWGILGWAGHLIVDIILLYLEFTSLMKQMYTTLCTSMRNENFQAFSEIYYSLGKS